MQGIVTGQIPTFIKQIEIIHIKEYLSFMNENLGLFVVEQEKIFYDRSTNSAAFYALK